MSRHLLRFLSPIIWSLNREPGFFFRKRPQDDTDGNSQLTQDLRELSVANLGSLASRLS